jgi:hypothetical protein
MTMNVRASWINHLIRRLSFCIPRRKKKIDWEKFWNLCFGGNHSRIFFDTEVDRQGQGSNKCKWKWTYRESCNSGVDLGLGVRTLPPKIRGLRWFARSVIWAWRRGFTRVFVQMLTKSWDLGSPGYKEVVNTVMGLYWCILKCVDRSSFELKSKLDWGSGDQNW